MRRGKKGGGGEREVCVVGKVLSIQKPQNSEKTLLTTLHSWPILKHVPASEFLQHVLHSMNMTHPSLFLSANLTSMRDTAVVLTKDLLAALRQSMQQENSLGSSCRHRLSERRSCAASITVSQAVSSCASWRLG